MNHYYFEPEIAGDLGDKAVVDWSTHPPIVTHLHYEFDSWVGDHIAACFPCFIVSESLAAALRANHLNGFDLRPMEQSVSEQFIELHPDKQLPLFLWLNVNGQTGVDDFALAQDHRLVVSERALRILEPFCPVFCDTTPFGGENNP